MSSTDSELRQMLRLYRIKIGELMDKVHTIEEAKKVVEECDSEVIALLAAQKQQWEVAARKDELKNFEPLFKGDHSKCPDRRTCIGYQNAQSDFDNEKELRLSALDGVIEQDSTVQ